MPGPIASTVALRAPWVLSLAGTTLPLAADACAALSAPAALSLRLLALWPHAMVRAAAATSALLEERVRISISRSGGFPAITTDFADGVPRGLPVAPSVPACP